MYAQLLCKLSIGAFKQWDALAWLIVLRASGRGLEMEFQCHPIEMQEEPIVAFAAVHRSLENEPPS